MNTEAYDRTTASDVAGFEAAIVKAERAVALYVEARDLMAAIDHHPCRGDTDAASLMIERADDKLFELRQTLKNYIAARALHREAMVAKA